jgi:hyperosmotically inducible protein
MKSKLLAAAALTALLGCAAAEAAGPAASAGIAVDDSVITAKIKSALIEEPAAKARDIKVKTRGGTVQLSGFVDSPEAKQRAEVIASTTEGVSAVHNGLKIRAAPAAPGEKLDDSLLTTKIKAALVENPDTKAREIKVTSERGVVLLSGFVGSADEKMTASKVAAAVAGVKRVENNLEVKDL